MTSALHPLRLGLPVKFAARHPHLLPRRYFSRSHPALVNQLLERKEHAAVIRCYQILEVDEDCEYTELREAYLKLAREYHPDSASGKASAGKFAQVKDAYKQIVKYRQAKGDAENDEEEQMIYDIKHTAPQHRQYLTYEGVGFGTPSQRHRQYQQYKVSRAAENVYEYRTEKMAAKYETAIVIRDKKATRKRTLRNAMDRLVEDLIAESMARGDFDNLPGKGKPLDYSNHNPMIDTATHNLNKILIDNGYVPEWVTLQKDIRKGIEEAREDLLKVRMKLGPSPLPQRETQQWENQLEIFSKSVELVNAKINKMNMVTPSLIQQKVPYRVDREVGKVLVLYCEKFERGEVAQEEDTASSAQFKQYSISATEEEHSLRVIWRDVKELFWSTRNGR